MSETEQAKLESKPTETETPKPPIPAPQTLIVAPEALAAEQSEPVVINRLETIPPLTSQSQTPNLDNASELIWKCPKCGVGKKYRSWLIKHIEKGHRDIADTLLPLVPGMIGRQVSQEQNAPAPEPEQAPPAAPDFSDITGQPSQTAQSPQNGQTFPPLATQVEAVVNYRALSEMTFDMATGIAAGVFGDEWKPREEAERQAVCVPLAAYLKSKNVTDIPPGVMLCVVVIAYSAPRLRAPSTAGKLKLAWEWVKAKNPFRRKRRLEIIN